MSQDIQAEVVKFEDIRRLSAGQLSKLSKRQLAEALQDAIRVSNVESDKSSDVTMHSLKSMLNDAIAEIKNDIVREYTQKLKDLENNLQSQILELKNERDYMSNIFAIETINEIEQRQRRETNVVINGIPELQSGDQTERYNHDTEKCGMLLRELEISDSKIQKVFRIGKLNRDKGRLIKLVLDSRTTRDILLSKARNLQNSSSFNNVFVNKDRTMLEQLHDKSLREELRSRKKNNEDVVIYRGKVCLKKDIRNFH